MYFSVISGEIDPHDSSSNEIEHFKFLHFNLIFILNFFRSILTKLNLIKMEIQDISNNSSLIMNT